VGFRPSVIGLALPGLCATRVWYLVRLLMLSLAISVEEMLESSIVIFALRRERCLVAQEDAVTQNLAAQGRRR